MVKFMSLNKAARTATFDVDGQSATRKIPAQFSPAMETVLVAQDTVNRKGEPAIVHVPVTRRVRPDLSDIDDILAAMAIGLQVEADEKAAHAAPKVIDTPTAKAGDVLADVFVAVK